MEFVAESLVLVLPIFRPLAIEYDADNRITQWSQTLDAATTATNWNYQYDPIGQLLNAVKSTGTTIQSQYSYVYDLAGNRTSAQATTGTTSSVTSAAFDSANKEGVQTAGGSLLWQGSSNNSLYAVTLNGQPGQLDSTQKKFSADVPVTTGSNTVTIIAEDTKANFSTNSYKVSGIVGNTESAPVYNSNGDTTTDAAGNTYMYDAKGEMVQETYKSGATTQFTYYMGNRVGITESTGTTPVLEWLKSTMALTSPSPQNDFSARDSSNILALRERVIFTQGITWGLFAS